MFGYVIAAVLGYGAGKVFGNASLRPAVASQWSGLIGATPFKVYRNGPTWAWEAPSGGGASATLVGALRAAVTFVLEAGAAQNGDGIDLRRDDGRVHAVVKPGAVSGSWSFVIESITPPMQTLTASATGTDYQSRGAAAVAMFERLSKYAEM